MNILNVILLFLFASSASARVIGTSHRSLTAENGQGIPGEYVILLGKNADPRGILQGLINGGQTADIQVLHVYENAVRGFAVRMNFNALFNALKHLDGVTITENQVVTVSSVQTPVDSWGLDRVDQVAGTNNQYSYERDGSNVDVYIVDTGIDRNHEDFGGRASFGIDVSGSGEGDVDLNGHGTHVAGTVGGTKYGIAKNANLISVKVFDSTGSGTASSVIAGLDWILGRPRLHGAVANLSMDVNVIIESIITAVNNAVAAGVVMVVAGGNSDSDACSSSPACAANAITVGATGSDDSRAYFSSGRSSNFGECIDIFAPGKSIVSAKTNTITESLSLSGTSMAAPHVAGVAALLLEEDPSLTPAGLLTKMLASATADAVRNPGVGSPNLLLYTGDITGPAPTPAPSPAPSPAPAPSPSPAPVAAPVCLAKGDICTADSQCCDSKCKGGNSKTCK